MTKSKTKQTPDVLYDQSLPGTIAFINERKKINLILFLSAFLPALSTWVFLEA